MKRILIFGIVLLILFGLFSVFSSYMEAEYRSQLGLEKLRSLPYLEYTEDVQDRNLSGVVLYDKDRAYDGYTVVDGRFIIDMEGNLLVTLPGDGNLQILFDDGVVADGDWGGNDNYFALYDKNFSLLLKKNIMIHHDMRRSYNHTFLTISREKKAYKGRKVLFDSIIRISETGETIDRWSTFDHFDEIRKRHYESSLEIPEYIWAKLFAKEDDNIDIYDYYHINSVQELPENSLDQTDSRFQQGNMLLSLHNVNLLIILDKDSKEIVWASGPDFLEGTHMPTMLANGNILLFDNGGETRDYSRVLELDPLKQEIVWNYTGNPPDSFFSESMGSVQRLPNGNTLISESEKGHVIEVTPDKEIVWEYWFPYFNRQGKRETIYRSSRMEKERINRLMGIWNTQ